MGFEGANVLFDTWVHPLMMGLEEHLLTMFRSDFEFHDGAAASHLGRTSAPVRARDASDEPPVVDEVAPAAVAAVEPAAPAPAATTEPGVAQWAADAQKELNKIPFFVRGKARRNTERFALDRGVPVITIETLYDAKAHYSR